MTPEAQSLVSDQATLSGLIVGFTQLVKWTKLVPDRWVIFIVAAFSILGTAILVAAHGPIGREHYVTLGVLFGNMMFTASGVYGFVREVPAMITGTSNNSRPE